MTIEEEIREHFNEVMLSHGELGRCIGYGEDNMDCYIIVMKERGQVIWNTCVGGYTWLTPLKGANAVRSKYTDEVWDDYTRLDSQLELNGAPKQETFKVVIERRQ